MRRITIPFAVLGLILLAVLMAGLWFGLAFIRADDLFRLHWER